ncbi:MAG TPA: SDR family oxidoreductase [Candidatus Onthousia faecigallinarum]|nr:SDR family oxidoreductase [Candidatus Onthousia faecigallinarum]
MKKTVFITGGDRGIGKAIALEYAKHGYNIIFTYYTKLERAEETAKEIEEKYQKEVSFFPLDLSQEEEINHLCEQLGDIDVLINNAGIALDTIFEDKAKENFEKILEVNLIGPFLLSKEIGKKMLEKKRGCIINISSTNGIDTPYIEGLDYDASKAALISLTHNLAQYFAPHIRVNAIASGWVDTEMNKDLGETFQAKEEEKILLGHFAKPEEIASVAYFLASDGASYITDTIIRVDGGVRR